MPKLNNSFLNNNKNKGFSLVEILMALGLLGIVGTMAGGLHIDALRIFNFQNAIVDRQQLYTSLAHTIGHEDSCKGNLAPQAGGFPTSGDVIGLYNDGTGADPLTDLKGKVKELYTFNKTGTTLTKRGNALIRIGNFGEILEVVKIALKNPDTTKNEGGVKQLKVYYKYRRGFFKTKSGGTCTNADQAGCYVMACTLGDYTHTGTPKVVDKCQASCTAVIVKGTGGGGSADCYLVDETGKTFVGCKDGTKTASGITTTGANNTFFGYNAGKRNTTGNKNTFIGYDSGSDTIKGVENVFLGFNSGKDNKEVNVFRDTVDWKREASRNTYVGAFAGEKNSKGRNHVFIGYRAGFNSEGGQSNTFIGSNAGFANRGGDNTFIGVQTGVKNATAGSNTFIGAYAGNFTTREDNIFIGRDAGRVNTTGVKNIFIGIKAGQGMWNNNPSISKPITGSENIAIGYQAGEGITTGEKNLFIGFQAGRSDLDSTTKTYVTNDDNIAIGYQAGTKLTSGTRNVFLGNGAGNKATSADWNTFIGYQAGYNTQSTSTAIGGNNVFIGTLAGYNNTVARRNTFIGTAAGYQTTKNGDNTFIGFSAGYHNKLGSKNIAIGSHAGWVLNYSGTDVKKGVGNIFIGHEDTSNTDYGGITGEGNYQLNIGNLLFGKMPSKASTDTTKPDIPKPPATNFFTDDNGTSSDTSDDKYLKNGVGLVVNGDLYSYKKIFLDCENGCKEAVGGNPSSRVFKNKITLFKNYQYSLSVINNTPLFTYYYNKDHPKHKRMGIISEDLPKHLQIHDKNEPPKPDWVSIYGTLWAGIKALSNNLNTLKKYVTDKINAISRNLQKLIHNTKELKKEIESLKKENIKIKEQIQALKKEVAQ